MEAYERVKYLRKDILKLSQEDFSKKINISRSNLGNIETGKIKLTERVINDICREFYVNLNWLTDNTEPVFENNKDPIVNEISVLYDKLTDDNKKYLYGYIQRLLDEQRLENKRE